MSNQPKPSASSRRAALRDQRANEAAQANRKRLLVRVGAVVAVVAALVAGLAVGAYFNSRPAESASGQVVIAATGPANSTSDGAVRIGKADAPVTVSIFTDFMCPYCKTFEEANAEMLSALLQSGKAKVDIYPFTFLDGASQGTRYSTRSANAFATIANANADQAWSFYQLLFAHQPDEGTTGLSDAQLAQLGEQAGASKEVVASFSKLAYRDWTDEVTRQWFPARVKGTPTVKINGVVFEGDPHTEGPLAEAIQKALVG